MSEDTLFGFSAGLAVVVFVVAGVLITEVLAATTIALAVLAFGAVCASFTR